MDESRPIPYWRLLAGVNRTQSWRRLKLAVSQSRLHAFLMGLFVVGYAWLAFGLFHKGLQFTSSFPGLGPVLIERMMFLLFAFLFLLLLLSNVIINFTNLFRNRETHFLLTLPVPHKVVYRWKIFESGILASWAFLFLIAPLVIAYGTTHNAPWHFYLVTPVFVALFVVLPGVLGSWAALGLARWLDRLAFQIAAMLVVVLVIVSISSWLQPETVTDEMLETRALDVVDRLLARTRFSLFPYLPSFWVSSGLTLWVEGAVMGTFFFRAGSAQSHAVFRLPRGDQVGRSVFRIALGGEQPGRRRGVEILETWIRRKPSAWPSGIQAQAARSLGQVVLVGQGGFPGVDRQGHPDVLARHHPVGAIAHSAWPAGGLHHESAVFLASADE